MEFWIYGILEMTDFVITKFQLKDYENSNCYRL